MPAEPKYEAAMTDSKQATKRTGSTTASAGWTDAEREAMKERARELKAEGRRGKKGAADGERDVLDKIAGMPEPDRSMAERIHALVKDAAPELAPRTWYGMPAWANRAGKVVCYFTPASKFKERYASFGFNADAHLDEGTMWPTAFALTELTPTDEARIAKLVKKAVS